MAWTNSAPALGNNIADDITNIRENFQYSHESTGKVDVIDSNAVDTDQLAADAVTGAKIADNAIDSEHYTNGSIDAAHLSADCIDGTKIADNAIDSEHYTNGSIDNAHLADDAVTTAKIDGLNATISEINNVADISAGGTNKNAHTHTDNDMIVISGMGVDANINSTSWSTMHTAYVYFPHTYNRFRFAAYYESNNVNDQCRVRCTAGGGTASFGYRGTSPGWEHSGEVNTSLSGWETITIQGDCETGNYAGTMYHWTLTAFQE